MVLQWQRSKFVNLQTLWWEVNSLFWEIGMWLPGRFWSVWVNLSFNPTRCCMRTRCEYLDLQAPSFIIHCNDWVSLLWLRLISFISQILFLNKINLCAGKVLRSPLEDYTGGNNYDTLLVTTCCTNFSALIRVATKWIYAHYTCGNGYPANIYTSLSFLLLWQLEWSRRALPHTFLWCLLQYRHIPQRQLNSV